MCSVVALPQALPGSWGLMHLAGAYSCESEVAAATRWNRVALASSVSLLKLVSVRPSRGVDILDKAGTGPEDRERGTLAMQTSSASTRTTRLLPFLLQLALGR